MTAPARALDTAPLPPQNLDAEESVIGAMMLSPLAIDAVCEKTPLRASDFYRESHGHIFRAVLALHAKRDPVDAITVVDELDRHERLDQAGGADRVHEIASIVPAASNAAHYARIVVEMATLRALIRAGNDIARLGFDRPGETLELVSRAQGIIETIADLGAPTKLEPLWLEQAIIEPVPDTAEYVDGVLEAGVLADIVGLPYLHKSAAALELAVKVAKGRGLFLGKYAIKQQAKVAYFWADDSRPQELKRIKAYAEANELAGRDLAVAFYLNPGLTLPEDLPTIKRQIRDHGYRLVVFDSLYNFADFDFVKDTGAVKHLYTQLKRLCDDVEGLTIVLVDHASKPSDSNRDRDDSISSYGAVWKAAAVRCSIVVTKKGPSLFVSATGNNVKGFPRTPAYFNQERLELALAEETQPDPGKEHRLDDDVLAEVQRKPGQSTNQIRLFLRRRQPDVAAALARLASENLVCDTYGSCSQLLGDTSGTTGQLADKPIPTAAGNKSTKTAWIPLEQAKKPVPDHNGDNPGTPIPGHGSFPTESYPESAPLYVVEGHSGEPEGEPQGSSQDDHERAPIDDTLAPDDDWLS